MTTFTYARTGKALRSTTNMFTSMLMGDVAVIVILVFILSEPWNWVTLVGGSVLVVLAVRLLRYPLRTAHTLDEAGLHLHMGRFRMTIPRDAIVGAQRYTAALPGGTPVPTRPAAYRPDTDTLYLLAEKQGLVEVQLSQPVERRKGNLAFEFTRLVLSLDDPDSLVSALNGTAPAAAVTAEAPRVAVSAHLWAGSGSAIRLEGLSKRFGDFQAVREVSLAVEPGEILAFLGSNGAGKTTTIKMMVGLLRPSAGRVLIGGRNVWAEGAEARRLVGYVPDVPILYEGLTAREFLWLMAGLYGLDRAEGRRRAEELLAMLKMERWGDHLMKGFSLGMKRKMAIAAALVHRPQVLLLDEVTNGLDPRATREVKDFILAAARAGTAVLLTTHLLDVAQELADRIAVIHRGEVRASGTLSELQGQAGRPLAGLEELFLAFTEDEPERGVSA